jgi:hypothetical protein
MRYCDMSEYLISKDSVEISENQAKDSVKISVAKIGRILATLHTTVRTTPDGAVC